MQQSRRQFVELIALGGTPVLAGAAPFARAPNLIDLGPGVTGGSLRPQSAESPLAGGTWYEALNAGGAIVYRFPAGTLQAARMLTADFLLDGNTSQVFTLELQEGEGGRRFRLTFAGLNQCSFRLRMELDLTNQNRWQADREGAFLKPMAGGDRVDPAKVDRAVVTLLRKADGAARFCMTPLRGATEEVPKLTEVLLPKGPLVDEFGQSRLHDWPGRTRSVEELRSRLRRQAAEARLHVQPENLSAWGGSKAHKLREPGGYFTVVRDGGRWWLVDPEGYAFWSAGADCVRVDTEARIDGIERALTWMPPARGFADAIRGGEGRRRNAKFVNYLAANFIRTFGERQWYDRWAATAAGELKRIGFNTVGNWSDWRVASKARFPYVRPLEQTVALAPRIYRDFPDVFDVDFRREAELAAESLRVTADDPALIGYFLMNEPTWGFSSELPAAGMLYTTETCATRRELVRYLTGKYPDEAAFARAWKMPVTRKQVEQGRWRQPLTAEAREDLRAFSSRMVAEYFQTLSAACKKVDPNHLNLGMRWAGVPPDWAVEGMKSFDVFSLNCYMEKLPRDRTERIYNLLEMPVMVGEWHFGALDVGLPASGIGHVPTQADRGRAYRVYLEDAVANPHCVGAHWFTLYDQSALGRFDGENYNIGFLDVCHRPYPELCEAASASHARLYEVATGKHAPFASAPQYLPKLFL